MDLLDKLRTQSNIQGSQIIDITPNPILQDKTVNFLSKKISFKTIIKHFFVL